MDQPFLAQPEALKSFQPVPRGTSAAQLGGKGLNEVPWVQKPLLPMRSCWDISQLSSPKSSVGGLC